jgi:hypothetical protein
MNTTQILTGPVTEDSLKMAFELAYVAPEEKPAQEKDQLCFISASLRSPEFYGLSFLSPFPAIGIVGRLREIELDGEKSFVMVPVNEMDAMRFRNIVGKLPDELDRILKEKTAPQPF